jgi:hypothetical protein
LSRAKAGEAEATAIAPAATVAIVPLARALESFFMARSPLIGRHSAVRENEFYAIRGEITLNCRDSRCSGKQRIS